MTPSNYLQTLTLSGFRLLAIHLFRIVFFITQFFESDVCEATATDKLGFYRATVSPSERRVIKGIA